MPVFAWRRPYHLTPFDMGSASESLHYLCVPEAAYHLWIMFWLVFVMLVGTLWFVLVRADRSMRRGAAIRRRLLERDPASRDWLDALDDDPSDELP